MVAVNHEIISIPKKILGNWYNQMGSNLHITEITKDGCIKGTYQSPIGTKGEQFQLNGTINSKAPVSNDGAYEIVISFTVNWKSYGSISSWVGYFEELNGIIYLHTKWHLITLNKASNQERIISAIDKFTHE